MSIGTGESDYVDQIIKGMISAYEIRSTGDTEYIIRKIIRLVLEELARSTNSTTKLEKHRGNAYHR